MLPDRVSNLGPLTYESDALPIALRGPAVGIDHVVITEVANVDAICFFLKRNVWGHYVT